MILPPNCNSPGEHVDQPVVLGAAYIQTNPYKSKIILLFFKDPILVPKNRYLHVMDGFIPQ